MRWARVWCGCRSAIVLVAVGLAGFGASGLASTRDSELTDPATQLNGTWTADFTVVQSSNPLAQVGQKLTGLEFTVQDRQISGDLSGSIDLTARQSAFSATIVYWASVTSSALGSDVSCSGNIEFTAQGFSYVQTGQGGISCQGGRILGSLEGHRTSEGPSGPTTTTQTTTVDTAETCGAVDVSTANPTFGATITLTNNSGATVDLYEFIAGRPKVFFHIEDGNTRDFPDRIVGSALWAKTQDGECLGHWVYQAGETSVTIPLRATTTTPTEPTTTGTTTTGEDWYCCTDASLRASYDPVRDLLTVTWTRPGSRACFESLAAGASVGDAGLIDSFVSLGRITYTGSGAVCDRTGFQVHPTVRGDVYLQVEFTCKPPVSSPADCGGGHTAEPIYSKAVKVTIGSPTGLVIAGLGDSVGSGEGLRPIADNRCHRSKGAYQALVAERVRRLIAQPRGASFRFVHLACSGASIEHGLVAPYAGLKPPAGAAPLPGQVDELARELGTTKPNAILLSIGANDLGFGGIVEFCVKNVRCNEQPYTFQGRTHLTLDAFVTARLRLLPILYARLAGRLQQDKLTPTHVFVTAYFDPLVGKQLEPCSYSVGPFNLSPAESRWASTRVVPGLNAAVAAAAKRNGWTYVGQIPAAFRGHGVCAGGQSWITGIYETLVRQRDPNGFMHPNAAGASVIAGFTYPLVAVAIRNDLARAESGR